MTLIQWDSQPYGIMRYATCGDWFWVGHMLRVITAKLSDPRYELLVQYHETTEAFICQQQGIAEEDITAFDLAYEECRKLKLRRAPCGCELEVEPGDDVHAPYGEAHETATQCERLLAQALGVVWADYEAEIDALG